MLGHSDRVPEGDVVWRTAQRLQAALAGREITVWDLRWPSLATTDLAGRTVTEVVSRGKHLLIRTDARLTLHSHLRMDGAWLVHRTGEPWRGRRGEANVRAVLANAAWTAQGHRLGMLDLVATDQEGTLVGHLGPDVLGPDWDPSQAVANLLSRPGRPVGEALLDQRHLAGVGTFFMCEALFLRGRTPWTPVAEVDVPALVALVHRLLGANRTRVVQATTGDTRPGRAQYVHARVGLPCRRCGRVIRVATLGQAPQERVAFWCPGCQSGPAPTDDGRPQAPLGHRAPAPATGSRRRRAAPAYRRGAAPGLQ